MTARHVKEGCQFAAHPAATAAGWARWLEESLCTEVVKVVPCVKFWKGQFQFAYYERPSVIVNSEETLEEAVRQHGLLISCSMAAAMAGVSDQRIQRLIELGKFTKIVVFGLIQIPKKEFDAWKNSPRISGRPRRQNNGCLSPTITHPPGAYDDRQLFAELPAQSKGCGRQK